MRFDLVATCSSARGQISNSMARTMMKNLVFASPLLNLLIFYYIFNRSGVQNAGEHVIVASALMTMWGTILWSSATEIGRERWMGTFELLLITPSWGWAAGGLALVGAAYFVASFGLYRLIFEKRLRKLGVGVA